LLLLILSFVTSTDSSEGFEVDEDLVVPTKHERNVVLSAFGDNDKIDPER
jgi:hypothetical protein